MRFAYAGPGDPRGMYVQRWISETGAWEVGLWPTLYGCRVRAGRTDGLTVAIDYCCGDDTTLLLKVLVVVKGLLEQLPESISARELEQHFPRNTIKPIDRDPIWQELQARVSTISGHYRQCP